MRTERVALWSEGARLSGWLHLPDAPSRRAPFMVQGPGWLGLADAKLYRPYHEAFTAAGVAVLIFDYRGFGESEGLRGTLSPAGQVEDWRNALAYMRGRSDMDDAKAAIFGSGGTGGGNAVAVAALEPSVRATISQVPVADGRDWLQGMRSEQDWAAFLDAVEADRRARAGGGPGTTVPPREGIMVETAERRSSSVKSDVDGRVPASVPLAAAQGILDYRPLDLAGRVHGLMVIAVENDAVTPTVHAVKLYERAGSPKKLVLQRNTTHYAAYRQNAAQVIPLMVGWIRSLVLSEEAAPRDASTVYVDSGEAA